MDRDAEKLAAARGRVVRMEALAERILAEARVSLMMSFRFLDRALWKMPFQPLRLAGVESASRVDAGAMLATDGHALFYHAPAVIGAFRSNPDAVARAYLHAVLHCIFRHPFRTVRADAGAWSLACDACVEAVALEMCRGRHPLPGDEAATTLLAHVSEGCGGLTPAKAYRLLLAARHGAGERGEMLLAQQLEGAANLLARDDHRLWELLAPPRDDDAPQPPASGNGADGGNGDGDGQSGEQDGGEDTAPQARANGDGQSGEQDGGEDTAPQARAGDDPDATADKGARPDSPELSNSPSPSHPSRPQPSPDSPAAGASEPAYSEGGAIHAPEAPAGDEQDWASIAQQVETELSTMQKERGEGAGTFMGNLALANRSRIDYADFLRRFATLSEEAKLSPDEFDYVFYTHGLRLYGNMPLVEPLEYTETDRIREFVIAIDTSGSCSQGLVNVFLARTCEILARSQGFDDEVNVHIVQCDADIQKVTVIHDVAELASFEAGVEVRGYGGTDFRPVFAYVDELIAARHFTDLRGLLYFTDGYGTFPSSAPAYDVAFVFVEEGGRQRRVPPWAMKVVLDQDQIYEMESYSEG